MLNSHLNTTSTESLSSSSKARQRSLQLRESFVYSHWMTVLRANNLDAVLNDEKITKTLQYSQSSEGNIVVDVTDKTNLQDSGSDEASFPHKSVMGEIGDAKLIYVMGR